MRYMEMTEKPQNKGIYIPEASVGPEREGGQGTLFALGQQVAAIPPGDPLRGD